MESLLIYRKMVAWALDSSGSRGLEAIPEQQRLVWLKKPCMCHSVLQEKKKKQVVDNCRSIHVTPISH